MYIFNSGIFYALIAAYAAAIYVGAAGTAFYLGVAAGLIVLLGLVGWGLKQGLGAANGIFAAVFVLVATVLAIFGAELGLAIVLVGCAICFIVVRYRAYQDRIAAAARTRLPNHTSSL
ncbi:hypothetical protein [Corynebacterium spheniscorum]|uniref:Uncharacterized protein n=1 Tax=Corynebacterium spheniscorum TaxID=185761 RepID=A0A1I2RT48_9CORY|nr:hypothetical protein [Corynebacterium spheniscorum]KAA8720968.1 hypothetical protein F4V56_06490 [Corynebacterium spheniscorum]SFG43875.1 hypothetical protein SAMN05660282_00889 [Corynebacterium spheniscorum]